MTEPGVREPYDKAFQVICSASVKAELDSMAERYGVSLAALVRECIVYALPAVRQAHEMVHGRVG